MQVSAHQYYVDRQQSIRTEIDAAVKELLRVKKQPATPESHRKIHRLHRQIAKLYMQLEAYQERITPYL